MDAEDPGEDISPSAFYETQAKPSCYMLSIVSSLIDAVHSGLCLQHWNHKWSQTPMGNKTLVKSRKTFPLHTQINYALCEDCSDPDKIHC